MQIEIKSSFDKPKDIKTFLLEIEKDYKNQYSPIYAGENRKKYKDKWKKYKKSEQYQLDLKEFISSKDGKYKDIIEKGENSEIVKKKYNKYLNEFNQIMEKFIAKEETLCNIEKTLGGPLTLENIHFKDFIEEAETIVRKEYIEYIQDELKYGVPSDFENSYYSNYCEPVYQMNEDALDNILNHDNNADCYYYHLANDLLEGMYFEDDIFNEALELSLNKILKRGDIDWIIEYFYEEEYYFDALEMISSQVNCRFDRILKEIGIIELGKLNKEFTDIVEALNTNKNEIEELKVEIPTIIPTDYTKLYPLARKIERHFVLHMGPTNSGKTYQSLKALKESKNGIYLGPLRLLAFEKFTDLNNEGFPCNLVTGEEIVEKENAKFQSSTIEMLDLEKSYDVAIIDEAQMIGDESRGGAWARAILGIQANVIHVCGSSDVKNLLIKLIESCNDTYEIVEHTRNTELIGKNDTFLNLDESIMPGDALIVFSRKSVHNVASYLQRHGKKCSIIYGKLPYDVRQSEAEKFRNKETQYLVSTDAIGMGLNLPIKRIVFLETFKFDGKKIRDLEATEIKQIAGRAGRFGIYDEGYYSSVDNFKLIDKGVKSELPEIAYAKIGFPEELIKLDFKLSNILKSWCEIEASSGFEKTDLKHEIELIKKIEKKTDNKKILHDFITIPFDEKNGYALSTWEDLFNMYISGKKVNFEEIKPFYPKTNLKSSNMQDLEIAYGICDLLFYFFYRFQKDENLELVMKEKENISNLMMEILSEEKIEGSVCERCGKKLPWNHQYKICNKCYRNYRW